MLSPAPTQYKKLWHLLPVASVGLLVAYLFLFSFRKTIEDYNAIQLMLTRAAVVLLLLYLGYEVLYKKLKRFLYEPLSPTSIAIFRVSWLGWQLLAMLVLQKNIAAEFLGKYAAYSYDMRVPVPYAEWLSMQLPVSPEIIQVVVVAYTISLVFSFLGLLTSISTKVYFISVLYMCFVPSLYGKVAHNHHMVWFAGLLAFSNCGQALSLDRLIRKYVLKKSYDDTASTEYGLPIKIGLLILGIIYFFPGFWKLWNVGFDWIFTTNLARIMYLKWSEMNGWLPFYRIDMQPTLITAMALLTVAFEFGFIFLCFYKRYRLPLLVTGILLHTGIYLFMNINFFTILPAYVLLVDWDVLFKIKTINTSAGTNISTKQYGLCLFAALIIIGNICAGFMKLNSYPFTCYPTFDYIVAKEVDVIRYAAYTNGKPSMGHAAIKKKICTYIPDYNIAALERNLMNADKNNDSTEVVALSKVIFTESNKLENVDSVEIYLARGDIMPKAKDRSVKIKRLYGFRYK